MSIQCAARFLSGIALMIVVAGCAVQTADDNGEAASDNTDSVAQLPPPNPPDDAGSPCAAQLALGADGRLVVKAYVCQAAEPRLPDPAQSSPIGSLPLRTGR